MFHRLRSLCDFGSRRASSDLQAYSSTGPAHLQFPVRFVSTAAGPPNPSPAPKPNPSSAPTHLQAVKEELASSCQGSTLRSPQGSLQTTPSIAPLTMNLHHTGAAPRLLTSEFLAIKEAGGMSDGRQEQQQQQERLSYSIPKTHTYLVLLNWKLSKRLPDFWEKAGTCICADGGSNRLHDELPAMMPEEDPEALRRRFLPSVIKGDLDSIRPEVLAFYKGLGVPVVDSSADQDTTDLTKCIAYIEEHLKLEEAQLKEAHCISPRICAEAAVADQRRYQQMLDSKQQQQQHGAFNGNIAQQESSPCTSEQKASQPLITLADGDQGGVQGSTPGLGCERVLLRERTFLQHKHQIIVLGALGGRLDHTLAAINTLHMFPDLNIVLLGDGNLVRLLPKGRSVIKPDRSSEGPMCGLVPMRGAATATSTGLRWNVDNTQMAFGGLVSTSNKICSDEIEVESDCDLIWTVELKD